MEVKCINIYKCSPIIREFLEKVSDLKNSEGKKIPISVTKNNTLFSGFGCYLREDMDYSALRFCYDASLLKTPYYSDEYTCFVHKERSYARGFASVTLCLLHEMGHFYTEKEVCKKYPSYNRVEEIKKIILSTHNLKNCDYEANKLYQQLPDELAATIWALDWLADAEHRKIAKAFERKFFANYEKKA